MNLKYDILDILPNPRDIDLPKYFKKTITEEKLVSGLSDEEIEEGHSTLIECYTNLKNKIPAPPDYSDPEVYITYIDNYLKNYYPRMFFIMNHLMKYTSFFDLLDSWNEKQIKILDIGAGPGTMCFSFIEYLEYINQLGTFDFKYSINIIERENNFINFINKLEANVENLNAKLKKTITIEKPIRPLSIDFNDVKQSLNAILGKVNYDVIILSFILNENEPQEEKNKKLFQSLSEHITDEGIIIFIGAASDYIHEYFQIDFKKEFGLNRNAPCLSGNLTYGIENNKRCPFFKPCGDLCTFQISQDERNKFCYMVLSKKDFLYDRYNNHLKKSVEFFKKYEHHLNIRTYSQKKPELGEVTDIIGILTNKERKLQKCDYYFCNGSCKFKIDGLELPELEIKEGDLVIFENLIYDGLYPKINKSHGKYIPKQMGEIGFKYNRDTSKGLLSNFEVIPYLSNA